MTSFVNAPFNKNAILVIIAIFINDIGIICINQ